MAWISNQNYKRRKKITITGQTGAGTNYQVLLKIGESSGATGEDFDLGGNSLKFPGVKNEGGDLAFTASDETTLIDFWVEQVTGASPNRLAYVWVEVSADLGSNQDIYVYYRNNSNPTNYSNGVNTFNFFDDFSGRDINTSSTWDVARGLTSDVASVSDDTSSQLDSTTAGSWTQFASKTYTNGVGYACRSRFRRRDTGSFGNLGRGFGMTKGNSSSDVGWNNANFEARAQHVHTGGTAQILKATVLANNTWYLAEVRWISSSKSIANLYTDAYVLDGNSPTTITDGAFSTASYVIGRSADGEDTQADWVLVRKTIDSTEPAYASVIGEETFTEPSTAWIDA